MLTLLFCLLVFGICDAEYTVRCGDGDGLSFVEAADGVEGRYRVEWCTEAQGASGSCDWLMYLRSNSNRTPEDCRRYDISKPSGALHSVFSEEVDIKLNCKYVCLSTNLDLIFNGSCYSFKMSLRAKSSRWRSSNDYVQYVLNNYTKEHFSNSRAVVEIKSTDDHVTANWFLGYVPATTYHMSICVTADRDHQENCTTVTDNCTVASGAQTTLACVLWPPRSAYVLRLQHEAPWCSGDAFFSRLVHLVHYTPLYVSPAGPADRVAAGGGSEWWWAAGAALALAVGGLAVALLCSSHFAAKLRERVARDWLNRRAREASAGAGGAGAGARRVLLLYARDCAPMMAVAAQLRQLLLHVADHVYDMYSAETVAEAARAPGEWLRRAVARDDTRVLLLQSPAAACLHAPTLRARGAALRLEQPLLNRRAMYRAPHSSDSLLPLALRLLTDTAHAEYTYKKYYIAEIEGLEAELVGSVTPLRRYSLPAGAALLLRDLAPSAAALDDSAPALAAQLQRFTEAVRTLHDYVRRKPDYLDEELIFFDYDT